MLGVTFGRPPNSLVLSEVLEDGPAFQALIQIGDEIIAFQEQEVQTAEEVVSIVQSTQPDDQIVIRIRRSDKERDVKVTLCDFASIVSLKSIHDAEQNAEQNADQ